MGLIQTVAKKIILAGDPHAFDDGSLLAEMEKNEQRIANAPDVQRIRAEVAAKGRREKFWIFIAGAILTAGLWGTIAWLMPGLVTPGMAIFMTCVLLVVQGGALRSLP